MRRKTGCVLQVGEQTKMIEREGNAKDNGGMLESLGRRPG